MPHALWLWAMADTADPPPSCQCRHCLQDKGAVRRKESSSQKSRKLVKSATSRSLPNRRSSAKLSGATQSHLPKVTTVALPHRTRRSSLIADGQSILARVRISAPIAAPSPDAHSVNTWPILHELVWCKLQRPIAWAEVLIDFWPGIIKEDIDGSNEYLVTLIGITHNVSITPGSMMPYRAHRVGETLVCVFQRCCRGETRVRLLNLDRCLRTELDDNLFSVVSSAFLFAITFSERLATLWSWTSKSNITDRGPVVAAPSQSRYALRSRRSKTEQYDALWWGPECIERGQLVQLKMSQDVISISEDLSVAPPLTTNHSAGPGRPTFLQIFSITHRQKSQRIEGSLAGPVVAGMIFELTDEHQDGE